MQILHAFVEYEMRLLPRTASSKRGRNSSCVLEMRRRNWPRRALYVHVFFVHRYPGTHVVIQARVEVLQSELASIKGLLAAKAGDESLAAFLAAEKSGDVTYVESLKERLSYVV